MTTATRAMSTRAAALAALGAASWAQAQQADGGQGAQPLERAGPAQIEEIVVTAHKRAETLKDVPSSVVVLTGDSLQREGAVKLESYVARVPGLVLNARSLGQQQISIRGISTGTSGSPTVATYIDDAPVGSSTGDAGLLTPDVDAIDLQRIEVLRGPQGTLYGASNVGGLLKYVTVAPDTKQMIGRVGVEGSSMEHGRDGYALRGLINFPVVDGKLGFLASAYTRRDPGFIDDAARDEEDVNDTSVDGGRLALSWTPSDALSIRISALGQDRTGDGFAIQDVAPDTLAPLHGELQQRRAPGTDTYASQMRLYSATADVDLGWGALVATSAYNTLDHRGNADNTQRFGPIFGPLFGVENLGLYAGNDIEQRKFSQELRLSSTAGESFEWLAGLFYTRERSSTFVHLPTFDALTGEPIALPVLIESDLGARFEEYAVFGEWTQHLTSRLDLILGGRYSANDQTLDENATGLLIGEPTLTHVESDDTSATFSVSPRLALNENINVYVRLATGYRPGGPNLSFVPEVRSFDPDTVVNYEIGLKGSLPRRDFAFEVAVFRVDWEDIQLQLQTELGLSYIDNAGEARSQGIEASGMYSPLPGLELTLAAAYMDAELARALPPGPQFARKGDQLPYSQRFKGTFSVDYSTTIFGTREAFFGASYQYTGETPTEFAAAADVPRIELPSYSIVNLRAGVVLDDWTLQLFARNVADERGFNSARLAGSVLQLGVIEPRAIGASIMKSF